MSALNNTHPTHPSQDVPAELAMGEATGLELPPAVPWLPQLRRLHWRDPLRWLQAGWLDFRAQPGIGVFYGACFVLMGWALVAMATYQPAYVLALAGGFMLMSPSLCLGLYEASRLRESGQPATLWRSLTTWRRNLSALAILAI